MVNLVMPGREMWSRRFARFTEESGLGRCAAVGQLLLFWDATRAAQLSQATCVQASAYLQGPAAGRAQTFEALVSCGYLQAVVGQAGLYTIVGNAEALARIEKLRARGRKGSARRIGKPVQKASTKSAAPAAGVVALPAKRTPLEEACHQTWLCYARAYETKTTRLPARNAQVNSKIKQLVQRVGMDNAPGVIRFYVERVTDRQVVEGLWPLGLLVIRAEAYLTQWQNNATVSSQRAQSYSATADYLQRQRDILEGRA